MFYKNIQKGFEKAVNDYVSVNDKIKVQEYTWFRINCYETGGFMKEHIDNIHHSHGQQYGYPSASCLFFLNDDYEGGEIVIADIMYKPEKGSAIIFPSNFMFPHFVDRVTKGERYSIITWLM